MNWIIGGCIALLAALALRQCLKKRGSCSCGHCAACPGCGEKDRKEPEGHDTI